MEFEPGTLLLYDDGSNHQTAAQPHYNYLNKNSFKST